MLNYLTINDTRLAYWSDHRGSDPGRRNLLFIHGSGGDHDAWSVQLAYFSGHYNLYALDLPGHGRSGGKGEEDVFAYMGWVRELIRTVPINDPVVIGHSLGAAISLALAARYPKIATGLVLVGGGAELPVNPMILEGLKNDPRGTIALAVKFSLAKANRERLSPAVADQVTRAEAGVFYGDLYACSLFNLKDALASLDLPTLVVCGDEDKLTPPVLSRYLKDNIPGASLALIGKAGHFVMQEESEAFNRALSDFLGSLPLPQGR